MVSDSSQGLASVSQNGNMAIHDAQHLLRSLLDQASSPFASGSMTCSIYDTAWLACVGRDIAGRRLWWFPQSFLYLLDHVLDEGGWNSDERGAGGLLSSLMGLYALILHQEDPCQLYRIAPTVLSSAITRTSVRVQHILDEWDVTTATEVGFELLVPMALDALMKKGIRFEFKAHGKLLEIRAAKLAKVNHEYVYSGKIASILHSLEVFYNDEDFHYDKMKGHTVSGSMMGSPAATAAYLIRCSEWDVEAEAYLNVVLQCGTGRGKGAVPSAYPSSCFELLWASSTLLSHTLKADQLEPELSKELSGFIDRNKVGALGLLSFAPGLPADLDDSSRASVTLSLLGLDGLSREIVQAFAGPKHFHTYEFERNPSLSANCNALLAILLDASQDHSSEVLKLVVFILVTFKKSVGLPIDKWNASPYYTAMLVSQALVATVRARTHGRLSTIPQSVFKEGITLALLQIMTRIVLEQSESGSWGGVEDTSYAALALVELSNAPFMSLFSQQVNHAVAKARSYLQSVSEDIPPQRIWIEKVRYGSHVLSKAYRIAALGSTPFDNVVVAPDHQTFNPESEETTKFLSFMQKLPSFNGLPRWLAIASWLEGQQFLPELQIVRKQVFRRENFSEDKYFTWIPFLWCAVNNVNKKFLPSDFLYDMMAISVLNYQADEFMENKIGTQLGDRLEEVRTLICSVFDAAEKSPKINGDSAGVNGSHEPQKEVHATNGVTKSSSDGHLLRTDGSDQDKLGSHASANDCAPDDPLTEATASLQRFRDFVTTRPSVRQASDSDLSALLAAMKHFLLAHVAQSEDSQRHLGLMRVSNEGSSHHSAVSTPLEPISSATRDGQFKSWVRLTAAEHTSCCYSWAFMRCLGQHFSARPGSSFFSSAYAGYVADDVCRHLATMCRMYNDFGSVRRDQLERNLNCVDFDELRCSPGDALACHACRRGTSQLANGNGEIEKDMSNGSIMNGCMKAKERLMSLAQYERSQLDTGLRAMRSVCDSQVMEIVDVFVGVTDVFGQIYEVRDIASRRIV